MYLQRLLIDGCTAWGELELPCFMTWGLRTLRWSCSWTIRHNYCSTISTRHYNTRCTPGAILCNQHLQHLNPARCKATPSALRSRPSVNRLPVRTQVHKSSIYSSTITQNASLLMMRTADEFNCGRRIITAYLATVPCSRQFSFPGPRKTQQTHSFHTAKHHANS